MRRFIVMLAAMVSVGLLGTLGTGDGLLSENQRADAQTPTRPNFVFVMTDDLDERSMEDLAGISERHGRKRHHLQERLRHLLLVLP